ncbi:protein of unknown function [Limnospira indica PCC 8005]|uniref:Uncharacterized protein n=1 Tax=Limnospira indica PCC 8005 TaxID=376219 RepID=A0A9P1NWQ1_9CYAN|nr:protein of unknown function [Limnospira indica PCC 8005]
MDTEKIVLIDGVMGRDEETVSQSYEREKSI